jgi:MOSC domain-containing protein YiiM
LAHIVSIVFTPANVEWKPPDHYARIAVERAVLVAGRGIEGDAKGKGDRQLNVIPAEVRDLLNADGFLTSAGELGEQLVIAGLEPGALAAGGRLRLGPAAVIEVMKPRTGCDRFEHIQGKRKVEATGRLGVLACVLHGGVIAVGDEVCVVQTAPQLA